MAGPNTSGGRKSYVRTVATLYQISPETLWGVYGTESEFGVNQGPSSAGAEGDFQFLPSTASRYGVNVHSFQSGARGAAHYLHDLGADSDPDSAATAKALDRYSGGGGTAYVGKVRENGKTLNKGAFNLGDVTDPIGSAVDTALAPMEAVAKFVNLLGQSDTWFRVGKVILGAAFIGMGVAGLTAIATRDVVAPAAKKVASVTPAGKATTAVKVASGV